MEDSKNIFLRAWGRMRGAGNGMLRPAPARDAVMIAGIVCALVIFFYKFVFLGMVPLNSDWLAQNFYPWKAMGLQAHTAYFNNDTDPVLYMYPIKYITVEIMKSGSIPLWNPYILCGAPLWGNNFACPLNPLNIVFFLFDFVKAWGIFLMAQFAVAGVSMYYLSREFGVRRLGAAIAAVAYMLNITFVIWFQTMSYLGVFAWLPFVFLMIERSVKTRSLITAFWCGVSFALFVWCGLIQLAAYCCVFSLAYLVFRSFQMGAVDRACAKKSFFIVMTVVAVAALFSLPELIIQKTNILNSTRTANRYGLSLLYPQMLVSYISPYFYGMKYDGWDLGFGTYIFNRGLIRLSPPYIGILPLFLAAIGFWARRGKEKFFFLLSSVGILAVLMSFALPVVYKPIMKFVPFLGSVDHYRLTTIYAFSMAVMAGWGVNALLDDAFSEKNIRRIAISVCVLIIAVFVVLSAVSCIDAASIGSVLKSAEKGASSLVLDGSHSLKSVYKFVEYLNMLKKSSGTIFLSGEVLVPAAFAVISLMLIIALLKFRRNRLLQAAAFLFVAFDLLYYGLMFPAYSTPGSTFPKTPSADFFSHDRSLYRVLGYSDRQESPKGDCYPPNAGMVYGLYDIRGYENLGQARWFYRFIMGDKPDEIVVERFNDYDNKFLPFMNIKYLMSKRPIVSDKWERVYNDEISIYKNKAPMPRAFVTGSVFRAENKEDAWHVMNERSFDPSRDVVVESGVTAGYASIPGAVSYPVIKKYGANEVVLDIGGDSKGMLVLSDAYYPGWKVFVDGRERPLLRADYAFRAVDVKKGDKVVVFAFRPSGFYESMYICFGLCALMLVLTARRLFLMRCPQC